MRIIGHHGSGCIAGAVSLPAEGPGFQTIRVSRSRFWGHPQTIAAIALLGARARAAGLGDLWIGDIGQPRGGPMPWGHVSHQSGLDADIWFDINPKPLLPVAQRERLEAPPLVRPDQRDIDPARWQPGHATLIRLATQLPGAERVLVHFAIKRHLCRTETGDRRWLRLVRPWWGHMAHLHVRFSCPPDQPECTSQAAPPASEGCDASLDWWFAQLDAPPQPGPAPPAPRPRAPPACNAVLIAR